MEKSKKIRNIALILPELVEGGVEQHVITLSRGLTSLGLGVMVVSAGGPLVAELPATTKHFEMPVDRKSLLTGIPCARQLAALCVRERVDIIHAHSRVPAWIALFAKNMTKLKFAFTAHARYSLNYALLPIKHADGVICVSQSVRDHLSPWLPKHAHVKVAYNAIPGKILPWTGSGGEIRRLLYLGRLTPKKGPMTLINALSRLETEGWMLDIAGDGPMRKELEEKTAELGIGDRVIFRGHVDDPAEWIAKCDLFLFPSQEEGMGLSLAEALSAGAPTLASNLDAVREIACGDGLLPANDFVAWRNALQRYFSGEYSPSLSLGIRLPNPEEMALQVTDFYREIIGTQNT